jgi:hypothetical protein
MSALTLPQAMIGSSLIQGGTSLAAGLLGGGSRDMKLMSTFSKNQKQIDQLIFDYLMGITRDAKGKEISRNPLMSQLQNMPTPKQRVAPLTERQKGVLNKADVLAGQGTPSLDKRYLSQLAQGTLPTDKIFQQKPRYLKKGGTLKAGDKAVVGEDGPEIINVKKGSVEVIPNPKTVANPKNLAKGLAKSEMAKKQYGVKKGAAALDYAPSYRKYGDYYVKYNAPSDYGSYWDASLPYTSSMQQDFNKYLAENYATENWYKQYQNQYGGDIGSVSYNVNRRGVPIGTPGNIQKGYAGALSDWWSTLPQATETPELTSLLAQIPESQRAGFETYLGTTAGSQYAPNLATNELGYRGTDWTFYDPYAVDVSALGLGVDEYMAGQGYTKETDTEGNWTGNWVAPVAEETPTYDYATLAGQLTPDHYGGFNEFLNTYQGGTLAGYGVNFNPTTGQSEFGTYYNGQWTPVPAEVAPGLEKAVQDYMAQQQATPPAETTTPPEETTTQTTAEGLPDYLTSIITGLVSQEFDPAKYEQQFAEGVTQPALKEFQEKTVPAIQEALAGGNLFGSAREKQILSSANDLNDYLTSERASYMTSTEENYETRRQTAINQAMTLATLPGTIASQKADQEYKTAVISNMYANQEIQTALAQSDLQNDQLALLMGLWQLYGGEQAQTNAEWTAEYVNALTGEDGINWSTLLSLLSGYQNQQQIAVVS